MPHFITRFTKHGIHNYPADLYLVFRYLRWFDDFRPNTCLNVYKTNLNTNCKVFLLVECCISFKFAKISPKFRFWPEYDIISGCYNDDFPEFSSIIDIFNTRPVSRSFIGFLTIQEQNLSAHDYICHVLPRSLCWRYRKPVNHLKSG